MNPLCNESTIRKAADWRAFKQGTVLMASVADAALTDTGWRGTVRDGKRPLRVAVIARTATDIEVRCPCREHQSTGAFCAHAVAVGLVLASEKTQPRGSRAPSTAAAAPPTGAIPVVAWQIHFPPPWRRMLADAKLAVKITATDAPSDASDHPFTAWLNETGAPRGGMLQLAGTRLAGFLMAVAGHPRVACDDASIEITSDALLRIATVERDRDRVVITPECSEIHRIANLSAILSENRISLATTPLPFECSALSQGKPASIPIGTFLAQAESLSGILAWPDEGWLAGLRFVAAKPDLEITFSAHGSRLDARPLVRYGEAPAVVTGSGSIHGLPELIGNVCRIRDTQAESQLINTLERHGFIRALDPPSLWQLLDENQIADFLNETMPSLESRYTIHHGPGLAKRIRECAVITPKFDIVASGEDWLEFKLSFQSNDHKCPIDPSEVWRMLKGGTAERPMRVSRELSEIIEPLFSELDLMQKDGLFTARGASKECIIQLRNYSDNTHNKNELNKLKFTIPATLCAELRPYQLIGAAWIWNCLNSFRGALLADDMGLGKTLQTIAVIERLFENDAGNNRSILVVATTSLLGSWSAEFGKFAPGRKVRILHGARRDAEKEQVESGEVWLTSFTTLFRDLAWYLRQDFLVVVVDEASLMRNPDTDHAKALFKLNAANRIALSGTPIENGVRDLWSIFRFIQPGWLGGRREFQQRYESPLGEGDPWALRRLRVKTAPLMLRRTKEEVAPELPAKIYIDEFVDLSKDQQAVYRELLAEGRRGVERLADAANPAAARMQMLTTLLRMRQACCDLALLGNDRLKQMDVLKRSAKMERLFELLNEAILGNHKVLIFSQFKTQLQEIRKCLNVRNIDSIQLDGSSRNRQELVDHFQSPDGPPVFLISLKAGGYGLNLTAADVVIHFDPWWNPAAEAQATDRAHRIGQTRPVTVYRLLTRGTVEEKVVSLQRRKRVIATAIDEFAQGALETEDGGGVDHSPLDAPGWNNQDIAALLS